MVDLGVPAWEDQSFLLHIIVEIYLHVWICKVNRVVHAVHFFAGKISMWTLFGCQKRARQCQRHNLCPSVIGFPFKTKTLHMSP